jgi:anti-anti-sigma factor
MSLLTLTTSQEQEAVRVALSGELDMSSALVFDDELKRIEDGGDPETLVLDLHELRFMDSTGLRLILNAHTRARKRGRRLRIVMANAAIKRIFRLTGLIDRLDIDDETATPASGARKR